MSWSNGTRRPEEPAHTSQAPRPLPTVGNRPDRVHWGSPRDPSPAPHPGPGPEHPLLRRSRSSSGLRAVRGPSTLCAPAAGADRRSSSPISVSSPSSAGDIGVIPGAALVSPVSCVGSPVAGDAEIEEIFPPRECPMSPFPHKLAGPIRLELFIAARWMGPPPHGPGGFAALVWGAGCLPSVTRRRGVQPGPTRRTSVVWLARLARPFPTGSDPLPDYHV